MTRRIRAMLVDDEPLARASLRAALAPHVDWEIVAEAEGTDSARVLLASSNPDVVFLDIRMPGESGLAFARELADGGAPPIIVFLTAFDEHALAAFSVHALDYLVKPLDDARLRETLARVRALRELEWRAVYGDALSAGVADATASMDTSPYLEQFCVRSIGRIDVVPLAEVVWLEASGNYVELHTREGKAILHRAPLADVERRLDPTVFMRIHRRSIVRIAECASLAVVGDRAYRLRLRSGARLSVSARYVTAVRAVLADGGGPARP
jgi:two-component system LytT family response regulator